MPESPDPIGPDPHRTITPGGFHVTSPWDRQYAAPEPAEPVHKPPVNPQIVDMKDLEEANAQLSDLIHDLEQRTSSVPIQSAIERLEDVRDLIYRNLR